MQKYATPIAPVDNSDVLLVHEREPCPKHYFVFIREPCVYSSIVILCFDCLDDAEFQPSNFRTILKRFGHSNSSFFGTSAKKLEESRNGSI